MQSFLYKNYTFNAVVASLLTIVVFTASFFAFEPLVAHGITNNFTVKQVVTSEIAFKTAPNNVTMSPSLPGLTGGNSFGTSTVSINTNNPTGYNMTINFATTVAMQGDNGLASKIANYTPAVGGTPDYNFTVPANASRFGYAVRSVTNAADVDARFKENGAACNTGAGTTAGKCWYNVASAISAVTILNRTTATAGTGATSTIIFRVGITANPVPAVQTGGYTATATLTAITNP